MLFDHYSYQTTPTHTYVSFSTCTDMMVVLLLSKQYRKLTLRAGEGGVRGGNENQLREQSREEDLKRKTIAEQENRGDQLAEETYGHDRRDTWGNNMIWRRVGVERKKSIQKKMSQKDNTRFSFTAKTVFDKFTFSKPVCTLIDKLVCQSYIGLNERFSIIRERRDEPYLNF